MGEENNSTGNRGSDVEDDLSDSQTSELKEGIDYYIENGLMVFTGTFLQKRGYCCESGCRHCPYGFIRNQHHRPS